MPRCELHSKLPLLFGAHARSDDGKPEAPTKRSLKDEQELEREERAKKTERLRKLRMAKEAADREKNSSPAPATMINIGIHS
jgi:hypothetical protein